MKNDLSPSDLMGLERAFQERVQQRKWAALDDREDPAPNTRALFRFLAGYLVVLAAALACVWWLVQFILRAGAV